MSTAWTDTFAGRTIASNTTGSWGTASDGVNAWTCVQGTGSPNTFAVSGGEGQLSEASGTGVILMRLGSITTATDMDVSCRMSPGTTGDSIHVFARISDSTHYYRLDMVVGGTSLVIGGKNGGSFFTLATSANVGFTMAISTFYWIRFRVIGTNLYGKIWIDGTNEPQSWTVTSTDSSVTSGGVGCGANPQGTAACQFDSFSATTIDLALSDTMSVGDGLTSSNQVNTTDSTALVEASTLKDAVAFTDATSFGDAVVSTSVAKQVDNIDGYRATILNDGPQGYWRLHETSGTTVFDETPNANNGTLSGTGTTQGVTGLIYGDTDTCYTFNGSGYVSLPLTFTQTGANPWSIEGWCSVSVLPSSYYCIAGFGTRSNQEAAMLFIHANGATAQAVLSTFAGDIGGGTITVGPIYYVVGTYDGTKTRLYVNGTLVAGPSAFTENIVTAFASIGADGVSGGSDKCNGTLDEIAIYNYALSSVQIAAHYNAGTAFQNETLSISSAETVTDNNVLTDATASTTLSTTTDQTTASDTLAPTTTFSKSENFNASINTTLWYLSATTTTLPTATGLANVSGGSLGAQALTTLGTATGFGEVHAQTYAGAWPSLGALGSPSGSGYLWDTTALEGWQINAQTFSPSLFLNCSPTTDTIIADIYLRMYKYNSGTYGFITQGVKSAQTISTGAGYNVSMTVPVTQFGPGDKLYIGTWLNVTTNSSADSTLKVNVQGRSSSNLGVFGQNAFGVFSISVGLGELSVTEVGTFNEDTTVLVDAASYIEVPALIDSNTFSNTHTIAEAPVGVDNLYGYRGAILNDNPIMYYRLNESSGSTFSDSTQNAQNGTLHGTEISYMQPGSLYADSDSSVLLSGSSTYISLPSRGVPTGANPWSIEAWVMVTSVLPNGTYHVVAGFGTYSTHQMATLMIYMNGSTPQQIFSGYGLDVGGSNLNLNQWYHLCNTYDGAIVRLYVNGVQSASGSAALNVVNSFVNIGAGPNTDYLDGFVDEVAFYNYALTLTQVAAHYKAGTSPLDTTSPTSMPTLTDSNSFSNSHTAVLNEQLVDSGALLVEATTLLSQGPSNFITWSDTFASRTVVSNTAGSWGVASDGETWSNLNGGTSGTTNWAVASGEGDINSTGNPVTIMKLGANTGTDMEVSCRIAPGTSTDTIDVFVRLTDSTHYYRLDFTGTSLQIGYKNGGSFTFVASANPGPTLTVGTFYWFRFRVIGTSLYGKLWQDGTPEPQTWTVTGTDTNIVTGGVGCGCNPKSSTNVQFDTFNAFTITPSSAVFTDSLSTAEFLTLPDIGVLSDKVVIVDVNINGPLLLAQTFCRSGLTITTCRGD